MKPLFSHDFGVRLIFNVQKLTEMKDLWAKTSNAAKDRLKDLKVNKQFRIIFWFWETVPLRTSLCFTGQLCSLEHICWQVRSAEQPRQDCPEANRWCQEGQQTSTFVASKRNCVKRWIFFEHFKYQFSTSLLALMERKKCLEIIYFLS